MARLSRRWRGRHPCPPSLDPAHSASAATERARSGALYPRVGRMAPGQCDGGAGTHGGTDWQLRVAQDGGLDYQRTNSIATCFGRLHSSSDGGPHPFRRLGARHFPLPLHRRCMAPGATPGALASRSEANSRALGRGIGARASPRVVGVVAGTRLPRFTSLVAHRRRADAGWFTATSPRPLLRHPSSPLRRLLGLPCLQSLS